MKEQRYDPPPQSQQQPIHLNDHAPTPSPTTAQDTCLQSQSQPQKTQDNSCQTPDSYTSSSRYRQL